MLCYLYAQAKHFYTHLYSLLAAITLTAQGVRIVTNGKITSTAASQKFPTDFLFGAATAAYQIEGAWNVNGEYQASYVYIQIPICIIIIV